MEQLLLLLHTNEPYNKTWHRATHKVLQHRLESNRIKMIVVKRLSDVQRLKVYHYSGTDRQTSIPLNGRTNVRMDGWIDGAAASCDADVLAPLVSRFHSFFENFGVERCIFEELLLNSLHHHDHSPPPPSSTVSVSLRF